MNILQLIASLSILVFIHELGHFFFARLFGTRVEKFYLFFNPWFSLFKWQSKRSGTIYGLGWLPLGGYCQIAGMIDESMDTEQMKQAPKPDEFRSKRAWQRLLIMAGGILFNLVLAFFLYAAIAFAWGDKKLSGDALMSGWSFSPAAEAAGFVDGDVVVAVDGNRDINVLDRSLLEAIINAKSVEVLRRGKPQVVSVPSDMMQRVLAEGKGFMSPNVPFVIDDIQNASLKNNGVQVGDKVVAVNDIATPNIESVITALQEYKAQEVRLSIERDSIVVLPAQVNDQGQLGVQLRAVDKIFPVEDVHYGLIESIPAGFSKAVETISNYVSGLKHIFTKEGAQSLGGLGTMAKLFPKGFDWQAFWATTAFLSVILAVMNLLPIPALDGGHIVFIIIEMLTGRKPNDKVMGYIQMTGMILLLLLMLYANGNDIYRYIIKD